MSRWCRLKSTKFFIHNPRINAALFSSSETQGAVSQVRIKDVTNIFKHGRRARAWNSLRASSPIWASEASLRRKRASERPSGEGPFLETRFTRPNRRARSQAKAMLENVRNIVLNGSGVIGHFSICGVYSQARSSIPPPSHPTFPHLPRIN